MHVHVSCPDGEASLARTNRVLCHAYSSHPELGRTQKVVGRRKDEIERAWEKFFKSEVQDISDTASGSLPEGKNSYCRSKLSLVQTPNLCRLQCSNCCTVPSLLADWMLTLISSRLSIQRSIHS